MKDERSEVGDSRSEGDGLKPPRFYASSMHFYTFPCNPMHFYAIPMRFLCTFYIGFGHVLLKHMPFSAGIASGVSREKKSRDRRGGRAAWPANEKTYNQKKDS